MTRAEVLTVVNSNTIIIYSNIMRGLSAADVVFGKLIFEFNFNVEYRLILDTYGQYQMRIIMKYHQRVLIRKWPALP